MLPYINTQDKGYKSRRQKENSHHILAKEAGGTNDDNNRIDLFIPVHQAIHTYAGTEKVKGQILQLLRINRTALTDDFINDILSVLQKNDVDYYYKKGVYCPKTDRIGSDTSDRLFSSLQKTLTL